MVIAILDIGGKFKHLAGGLTGTEGFWGVLRAMERSGSNTLHG